MKDYQIVIGLLAIALGLYLGLTNIGQMYCYAEIEQRSSWENCFKH